MKIPTNNTENNAPETINAREAPTKEEATFLKNDIYRKF